MLRKFQLMIIIMLFISLYSSHIFAVVSTNNPDLSVSVIDNQQGIIEVTNLGDKKSPPTELYVVCTLIWQGESTRCARGLNLSNYIDKWNVLSFQVPELNKNQHFKIQLFSEKQLPRKSGFYGIRFTVDPLKKIVEYNESNNQARLDVKLTNTIIEENGVLSLIFNDESNSGYIKRQYALSAFGHKNYIKQGEISHLRPVKLSLKPGRYNLHIIHQWQQTKSRTVGDFSLNPVIGPEIIQTITDIKIKPKSNTIQNIIFKPKETGKLHVSAFLDGRASDAQIRIFRQSDKLLVFSTLPATTSTPLDLNLISGEYILYINPIGSISGSTFVGYPDKSFEPQEFKVTIKHNIQINKTARFKHINKSPIAFKVLLNGVAVKAKIQVKPLEKNEQYYRTVLSKYELFRNHFELLPGRYDLLITPYTLHLTMPAISTYHKAGFTLGGIKYYPNKQKAITLSNIQIKLDEKIEKTINIK